MLERKNQFNRLEVTGLKEILESFQKQETLFGHNTEAFGLYISKLEEQLKMHVFHVPVANNDSFSLIYIYVYFLALYVCIYISAYDIYCWFF